jgi:hypothetical protein
LVNGDKKTEAETGSQAAAGTDRHAEHEQQQQQQQQASPVQTVSNSIGGRAELIKTQDAVASANHLIVAEQARAQRAAPPPVFDAPAAAGTKTGQASEGRVTLAIRLEEDYAALCSTSEDMQRFRLAVVRDLASSLHANPARFDLVSVSPGSILITLNVLADPSHQDPRSCQQLAAQMIALANDASSVLRGKPSLLAVSKVEQLSPMPDLTSRLVFNPNLPSRSRILTHPDLKAATTRKEQSAQGGLGLQFEMRPHASGVSMPVVTALTPDAPAERSGQVFVGDSILTCDGEPCADKTSAVLADLMTGLPGSVCRMHLQAPGTNALIRSVSLMRSKVAGVGSQQMSYAADMIANSLMSPAYRKAPRHITTPSHFTDTFKRVQQRPSLTPASQHTSQESPQLARRLSLNESQLSLAASSVSPAKQIEIETRMRAHLAMAEKEAEEEAVRARKDEAQSALVKQEHVRAQRAPPPPAPPRQSDRGIGLPTTTTPPPPQHVQPQGKVQQEQQAVQADNAAAAAAAAAAATTTTAAAQAQGQAQAAAQQRQRHMMQQKLHAVKPSPPPPAGTPKVVATVVAARNLPVTQKFGRATPYVIMAIGNRSLCISTSSLLSPCSCPGTRNPKPHASCC